METMRNPQSAWYAKHLHHYETGQAGTDLAVADDGSLASPEAQASRAQLLLGGATAPSLWGTDAAVMSGTPAQGPGLLRMAVSAAKSMARFIGSGFKLVPANIVQARLRTCAACEHHTGLRCRLCGCFTNAKARLDHEECPIGKWPR